VGVVTVDASELNRDRRCANDDLYGPGFRDGTLTVVRLDEVDARGTPVRPLTGLVHFALHGTADLSRLEAAQLVFENGDPGLGTPRVALEREVNDQFEAFQASAVRVIEGGPEIVLFYEPEPSIGDAPVVSARAHRWRALWETLADTSVERYRLVARGRAVVDGVVATYAVTGNAFTLSPSDAFGHSGSARLTARGESSSSRCAYPPTLRCATRRARCRATSACATRAPWLGKERGPAGRGHRLARRTRWELAPLEPDLARGARGLRRIWASLRTRGHPSGRRRRREWLRRWRRTSDACRAACRRGRQCARTTHLPGMASP
jgi:hypothetical protein